jgi:hypothetical protein
VSDLTEPRCVDCGKPSDLNLNPTGLFCRECELQRRERITASMATVTESFAARRNEPSK